MFQNLLTFCRKNKMKQLTFTDDEVEKLFKKDTFFWCTKQSKHALIISKCHIRQRWFQNVYLSWSGGRFFFSKLYCTLQSLFSFTSDSTLLPHRWISAVFWFLQVLDENYLSHVLLFGLTLHWKGATTLTPKNSSEMLACSTVHSPLTRMNKLRSKQHQNRVFAISSSYQNTLHPAGV